MAKSELQAPAKNLCFEDLIQSTTSYMDKLAASMPRNEHRMTSGMLYGEQAKYVAWDLPAKKFDHVELLQVTDVQFGHVHCKYDRVIEYRDWILKEPNRFMLWTGDNVDAWAMWSPGRAFDQIADPQSQVFKFCEVWAPARHRILGYVGGNHERRAIPGFGDLGILIATLLKVPYSNGRQFVDIRFGKHQPFKVALWHGVGASRSKGAVTNVLHRFMGQGDAQLYLMGHLHQAVLLPDWKEIRDTDRQRVKLQKTIGAIGTSFLETWGTYGEVAGYAGSDVMMARAVLEADGKWELTLR